MAETDLISRQAAIEAIGQNQKIDTKEYTDGYIDGRYDAINAIKELPPFNAHNTLEALEMRWIPCSERLPEECGNYLVTAELKGRVYTMADYLVREERTAYWTSAVKIIAWQPLPEPYKESEE